MKSKNNEIELKTMLTKNEYDKMINNNEIDESLLFEQFYLYFSRLDGELVRLRKYDQKIELTRKTRTKLSNNIENNITIDQQRFDKIIASPVLILEYWPELKPEYLFKTIHWASTARKIVYQTEYTLMIDKTTFWDGYTDYELEVEFRSENAIEDKFKTIIKQNRIIKKQSITKIERTLNRRKMNNKFYITTPIYYPSGKLHIGHAYSTVIADSQARYQKMLGKEVFFLTGTDEHGQKIQQKSQELNLSEIDFLDQNISQIKKLWQSLDIDYSKFIRTTDEQHIKTIKAIFTKLLANGDIYLGNYSGWYSVPDESYYPINQIKDPTMDENGKVIGGKSPDSDHPLQEITEECYFFNIKKYAKWLEETLLNSDLLVPKSRVSEIMNSFLTDEVEDLAISRTSFNWGIKIDENPEHVVYVWLDALFNYVTALDYNPNLSMDQQSELFKKFWPANIHIVGKEIIRFHGMYWPIFLKALDLPLPEKIYAHGWIMSDQGKMSKSKGNVIDPNQLIELIDSDYLRLFMLSEYPLNSDGIFTYRNYLERYNTMLANDLGNMISRISGMVLSYLNGKIEPINYENQLIIKLDQLRETVHQEYHQYMPIFDYKNAVKSVFELINQGNKLIDELKPWELNSNGEKQLIQQLLCLLHEISVDVVAYLLPIMPNIANKTTKILQVETFDFKTKYKLIQPKIFVKNSPIFSRLKIEEVIKELE